MKIILLLPSQLSKYSNLYDVYYYLYLGLIYLNLDVEIVEIKKNFKTIKFPYMNIKSIEIKHIKDFIFENTNYSTYFITVDDFDIMHEIAKIGKIQNFLIWAHYFYGHRFIFRRYRYVDPILNSIKDIIINRSIGYIPQSLSSIKSKFYYNALSNNFVISQSLWTALLIERVYSIPIRGILKIPINSEMYNLNLNTERKNVLIFLGDKRDTDLNSLFETIILLKKLYKDVKFDYFGNNSTGELFQKHYDIKLNYLGKIEKKELLNIYNTHILTITPIYNGNFEMVPIESLLCGTPVITYIQPFMEVTGDNLMIANINNTKEIENRIVQWRDIDIKIKVDIKNNILNEMDNKIIAKKLLEFINEI